jgi:hypothetical protein
MRRTTPPPIYIYRLLASFLFKRRWRRSGYGLPKTGRDSVTISPSSQSRTERLQRAKARLDRLDLYPEPVRLDGVRLVVVPLVFRLPGLRRYQGYALRRTILLRSAEASDDLLVHELCHIWQMQHRPLESMLAWLRYRYRENPFEREARRAAEPTRRVT